MKIVSQSIIFISATTGLIHMVLVGFFNGFLLVFFTISLFIISGLKYKY